ncbi:MAG: ATP-binding protein [Enterocloster sp.]
MRRQRTTYLTVSTRETALHTAEGNGIGLTVVEKIVHLHKGQISVVSEAGIGTTFTVNLPIIPPSSVL